jgi:hypothetical protein
LIRKAGVNDIDEIAEWGRKFYDASLFPERIDFNAGDLKTSLRSMIEGDGAVFLNGHGICGGVIVPLYFNHSAKTAVELFWYAERGGRGLRRAFEAWAKDAGATGLQWTCLADENETRLRKHYGRLGMTPMETSFWRAL